MDGDVVQQLPQGDVGLILGTIISKQGYIGLILGTIISKQGYEVYSVKNVKYLLIPFCVLRGTHCTVEVT